MQPDNKNDTCRFMRQQPVLGERICIHLAARVGEADGRKGLCPGESA